MLYIQILIPNEYVIISFDHVRVQKPLRVPPGNIGTIHGYHRLLQTRANLKISEVNICDNSRIRGATPMQREPLLETYRIKMVLKN